MINYQKSNKPQLDLNKIEKIIIERQKKKKMRISLKNANVFSKRKQEDT